MITLCIFCAIIIIVLYLRRPLNWWSYDKYPYTLYTYFSNVDAKNDTLAVQESPHLIKIMAYIANGKGPRMCDERKI